MHQQSSVYGLQVCTVQIRLVVWLEAAEIGEERLGHSDPNLVAAVVEAFEQLRVDVVQAITGQSRSHEVKDSRHDTTTDKSCRLIVVVLHRTDDLSQQLLNHWRQLQQQWCVQWDTRAK